MTDAAPKKRFKLRPIVRSLHRDVGYFAVGLTFVYALSGLAVNHIADWDPNFTQIERSHQVSAPKVGSAEQMANDVLQQLGRTEKPNDVYLASEQQLDIVFDATTLHVDTKSGKISEEGQQPRFFLRVANWLHLNRGKKAWSYFADAYAVFLLYLATSGLFMLPGKNGFWGRGLLIAAGGVAIPVLYVVLSGGP